MTSVGASETVSVFTETNFTEFTKFLGTKMVGLVEELLVQLEHLTPAPAPAA